MKIRNGFVSNSSSSSFIIAGAVMDRDIFMELTGMDEEAFGEYIENAPWCDDIDIDGVTFDVTSDYGGDNMVIGNKIHSGDGFYGVDSFDAVEFEQGMKSKQVELLKEKGYITKIHIGVIGDG